MEGNAIEAVCALLTRPGNAQSPVTCDATARHSASESLRLPRYLGVRDTQPEYNGLSVSTTWFPTSERDPMTFFQQVAGHGYRGRDECPIIAGEEVHSDIEPYSLNLCSTSP